MKENWIIVVSFKTELLTESLIHKGHREVISQMFPWFGPYKNRMIVDNDIYIDLNETSKIQEKFAENIIELGRKMQDTIEKQSIKLLEVANEVSINFKGLSNNELSERLDKFFQEYKAAVGLIGIPTILDFELESEVKEILQEGGKNVLEIFPFLAVSSKQIETVKERDELLDIAIRVQEDKLNLDSEEFDEVVKKHAEKYGWIYSTLFQFGNYGKKEIKNEIQSLKNAAEMKEKFLKEREKRLEEANEVIENILSEEGKDKARFLQEAIYFRTARIEWMNKACFIVRSLFEEVANRIRVSFNELIYMLPEEIHDSLKIGVADDSLKKKIIERQDGYSYISDNDNEYLLLTGSELKEWKEKLVKLEVGNDIKGVTANKGIIRGIVKVVRDRGELDKVEVGNILVSSLTTPDFIVAMRKAVAIVTDFGGLTSHAAIVSRELGVPCIVGTKNATKILEDGDIVEVNADEGIVRKIK